MWYFKNLREHQSKIRWYPQQIDSKTISKTRPNLYYSHLYSHKHILNLIVRSRISHISRYHQPTNFPPIEGQTKIYFERSYDLSTPIHSLVDILKTFSSIETRTSDKQFMILNFPFCHNH